MSDVIDKTQVPVDDTNAGNGATSDVDTGGDKGKAESGKAAAAQQYIDGLLTKYDLDTPEALGELIDGLAGISEKVGDHDIDDLIDNKNLMIQYQAQWAAQEEAQKRERETPEETIERLSKELKTREDRAALEKQRRKEEKENDRLIASFNSFVSKEVKALNDVGKHLKPFLTKYLGVNNPIHDHDLSDRAGIRALVQEAGEAIVSLEKAILEKHGIKGDQPAGGSAAAAAATPPVSTPGESSGDGAAEGGPVVKNLKDARKVATAHLLAKLGKGR